MKIMTRSQEFNLLEKNEKIILMYTISIKLLMNICQENNIYDSSKKLILTYPLDTLLDKICIDLWSVIYKYRNIHYQIFIGRIDKEYPGYKKIKYNKPQQIFDGIFGEIYRANNGYISLDDFEPGSSISFDDGYCIVFRNKLITISPESKNKLIRLETINAYGHQIVSNHMSDIIRSARRTALFCFFVMNEYSDHYSLQKK